MTADTVRELRDDGERRDVFPIVRQLRTHLTEDRYIELLEEMRSEGYRLFALSHAAEVVAVCGVGIKTNFYYGRHAFVYDLVTDEDHQSRGYGSQLLDHVEQWATNRDCEYVALESGLWRDRAHAFYEERGYERYCYSFRKELSDDTR